MPLSVFRSLSWLLIYLQVSVVDLHQDFSRILSIAWISVHVHFADAQTLLRWSRCAGSLVPGSIQCAKSITTVRWVITVVVVDLIRRILFVKTCVGDNRLCLDDTPLAALFHSHVYCSLDIITLISLPHLYLLFLAYQSSHIAMQWFMYHYLWPVRLIR